MLSHEPLDDTAEAPPLKRIKIDDTAAETDVQAATPPPTTAATAVTSELGANILPPSHSLLGIAPPLQDENGSIIRIMESDVGISEYIAKDAPKIGGIIKQRCAALVVCIKYLLTCLKGLPTSWSTKWIKTAMSFTLNPSECLSLPRKRGRKRRGHQGRSTEMFLHLRKPPLLKSSSLLRSLVLTLWLTRLRETVLNNPPLMYLERRGQTSSRHVSLHSCPQPK
jgi:hypothetical protein